MQSKPRERERLYSFPVFSNYYVRIVISEDIVASRTLRNRRIGEVYDGLPALGLHSWPSTGGGEAWLFFPSSAKMSTVAHECLHCVHRMMRWIGADYDNEVYAYHLGYLVGKAHEQLTAFHTCTRKRS